jgi:hypothetical protein
VRLRECFTVVLISGASAVAFAQSGSSPWAGEWGIFKQMPSTDVRRYEGRGLSISECAEQHCAFSVLVENKVGHGNATGLLQVYSGTEAVAHLLSGNKEYCSLRMTLDPRQPAINVQQDAGDCSYFETPGATFVQSYALHARDSYVFYDTTACFAAVDPAMLTLCTSKELSEQQTKWQLLFYKVADLGEQRSGLAEGVQKQAAQDGLMQNCDSAGQIAKCLRDGFAQSTKELEARQAAWLEGVTAPGDPGKAAEAAAAIVGSYQRSFPNGDVQGADFLSTDTLKVTELANNAIHYSLELQFYNGHECSLEGTANYRRAGFFVDQQKTDQPKFPLCVFEILPDENGVKFRDPTGACKMMSCGERGGYNGAQFSFKDRR